MFGSRSQLLKLLAGRYLESGGRLAPSVEPRLTGAAIIEVGSGRLFTGVESGKETERAAIHRPLIKRIPHVDFGCK